MSTVASAALAAILAFGFVAEAPASAEVPATRAAGSEMPGGLEMPAGPWVRLGPERPTAIWPGACSTDPGSEYYAFDLVTTKNIPGTGLATGRAQVLVSGSSPFSVSLGPDGSYLYDVHVSLERMKAPKGGRLVAWVTTTEIDRIARLGVLDDDLTTSGTVSWNKFIVVVTLESDDAPDAERWSGPVVFRGMSRSGMMHTMVGHGALQQENCGAYGYGN